jgi:hypothetical protein
MRSRGPQLRLVPAGDIRRIQTLMVLILLLQLVNTVLAFL